LDIALEVVEQPFMRNELVGRLDPCDMAMVSLAAFVVVPHTLVTRPAVEQPLLEAMLTRRQRLRKLPEHDFDDGPVIADFLCTREWRGFYVLHDSNTLRRCRARCIRRNRATSESAQSDQLRASDTAISTATRQRRLPTSGAARGQRWRVAQRPRLRPHARMPTAFDHDEIKKA